MSWYPGLRGLLSLLLTATALAGLVMPAATAGDWPQWRGPDRSYVSAETGLLKEWPKDGPPLLWKAEGLDHGVASVAVAGGHVFTLGYRGDSEFVTASKCGARASVRRSRKRPACAG